MNKSSDLYVPRPIRIVTTLSITGTCFKEAMGVWQTFSGVIVDILKDVANRGNHAPIHNGVVTAPCPNLNPIYTRHFLGIKENSFPNTGMDGS